MKWGTDWPTHQENFDGIILSHTRSSDITSALVLEKAFKCVLFFRHLLPSDTERDFLERYHVIYVYLKCFLEIQGDVRYNFTSKWANLVTKVSQGNYLIGTLSWAFKNHPFKECQMTVSHLPKCFPHSPDLTKLRIQRSQVDAETGLVQVWEAGPGNHGFGTHQCGL